MSKPYQFSSPSLPNIPHKIVHAIRGRIRYNIPLISNDPDYTERLQKALESVSSITGTRVNRIAASIIINYNPALITETQIQAKVGELINTVAIEQVLANSPEALPTTPELITPNIKLVENEILPKNSIPTNENLVSEHEETQEQLNTENNLNPEQIKETEKDLNPEPNISAIENSAIESIKQSQEELPEIIPPAISQTTIEALENSYLEPTNLESYSNEENPIEIITPASSATLTLASPSPSEDITTIPENDYFSEIPDDVEMSLFDHLEELRLRIFYSLLAVVIGAGGSFFAVKPIVQFLEIPAQQVKFIQIAPGEYFFVSVKTAAYSGILLATPFILYQIIQFVLPGLTRRERRFLAPIVFGSSILFIAGLAFSYIALIPAALNFLINYGEGVVEQLLSIDRYFEFVLLLMLSTGLAFQIPVIQMLLGLLGIVSSKQMLSGWRYVLLGGTVLGAILTPSTDPITQMLLAGAVIGLYFGGTGAVMLLGR
jgi:sec-independent protein translocase protein TatC